MIFTFAVAFAFALAVAFCGLLWILLFLGMAIHALTLKWAIACLPHVAFGWMPKIASRTPAAFSCVLIHILAARLIITAGW